MRTVLDGCRMKAIDRYNIETIGIPSLDVYKRQTLYGSMSRLVLIVAIRRYQNRGHHGKGTKGRCHHIAHDITVIILAGPDIAALGLDHPCHRVIDQRIEIGLSLIHI